MDNSAGNFVKNDEKILHLKFFDTVLVLCRIRFL